MKTVLITGCSSGFGRGMVDEFLQQGWHVIATMRQADQRQDLLEPLLEQYDHRLTLLNLDVTQSEQIQDVVEFVQQEGRLHCLINNAGSCYLGALEDLSEAQIRAQFEVNFFGATMLTRSLLPYLRQNQGSLIFLSSIFGFLGFPLTAAYCASKFAIEGLAETLHYELKPHGVHVALLEPGGSKTNFGKNVIWAAEASLAYEQQTQNYHHLKERISTKAQNNTAQIARKAVDIAEGRDRRLRVRVGPDAVQTHWSKTLTPEWVWLKLMHQFYRRTFLSSTPHP